MEENMRSAERNDVDITQLFKYKKEVKVSDPLSGDSATFYMRIIGDADQAKSRVHGLRKSGNLRKELRQVDSDMRSAFINELPEFKGKETLISAVVFLNLGDIQRLAMKEVDVPEPKVPPGDATLESLEEYQKAVDSFGERYQKSLEKEMDKISKKEIKRLNRLEEKEIYDLYEALVIDKLCSEEMANSYYQMCVYLATYEDSDYKKRAFKSFDDFDNAAPQLKEKLLSEYRTLEMGLDALKKSPEALGLKVSGPMQKD
jgi:hypothetical protein